VISDKAQSQGFALLLTLVVVSVIGVVAFGVGRLTLTEFKQGLQFQNSQDALQTAEAGIEDGLLRYRYDRNTEVPFGSKDTCSVSTEPTDTTSFVLRVNLTTGTRSCINPLVTVAPNPSEHVYDLKIYYKSKSLNPSTSPVVAKDGTYNISGIDSSTTNLTITAKDSSASSNCAKQTNPQNAYVQIEYTATDGSVSSKPEILTEGSRDYNRLIGGGYSPLISGSTSVEIKPLENCIQLGGQLSGANPIDFGTTIVQSVGYYNGVKRSLSSYINRSTGTTQGIYNYVLFSPGPLIQNP